MADLRRTRLRTRTMAIVPIVLFLPTLVSFAVSEPGVVWPEYTGVFFHLAILLLVARLDAPAWAKAAGYSWVALDVLTGIMSINGVAYDITWPVRLGGHVFAGTWILMSSLFARHQPTRVVGALAGIWLGSYSFVANIAPHAALAPSSLLIIVWFVLLAAKYDSTGTPHADTVPAALLSKPQPANPHR